jgi:hypothetical protein
MKGKEIIEILTSYNENGISFEFLGNTGMNYKLRVEGAAGNDEAAALVKSLIKGSEYGKVLYFSVNVEE